VILYQNARSITDLGVILQDVIKIDEDLLANSARSLETLVTVGMRLGVATKKQTKVGMP
jgi:phosphatidylserine decarboxylase